MSVLTQLMFYLSYLLLRSELANAGATVTIEDAADYKIQKTCVQNAVYWAVNGVGCGDWYNECFCRADVTASVLSYLSSRIPNECSSNDVDLSSGVEVYTSYCNQAMGQVVVAATTNANTDATYATATNVYTTSNNNYATPYATATPVGSVDSNSSGSGYSGPTYTNTARPGDSLSSLRLTFCLVVAASGVLALSIIL